MRRHKVISLLLAVAVATGVLVACKARSKQGAVTKDIDSGTGQTSSPGRETGSIDNLIAILF